MRRALLTCALSLTVAAWTAAGVACGGDAFQSGPGDAGSHATEAGVEGGVLGDTGGGPADSGGPPVEAGSSWCSMQSPQPLFCEDFDEYASVNGLLGSATWSTNEQSKGTFGFDTTNALSQPNALEVTGGDGAQVLLVKTFASSGAPKRLRLDFDLRIDSAGKISTFSAAGFAAIAFGNTIDDGYAAIAIGNGPVLAAIWSLSTDAGASDAGAFMTANAPSGTFPSAGVWAGRYGLEITFGAVTGAPGCIQVYQGPTPQLTPCLTLPSAITRPGAISIALGDVAGGLGFTGQVDMEFDNVTFDITP
jgi:hypothetical protein